MNGGSAALWAEMIKVRRSPMPVITAIGGSIAPVVGGIFMVILKDPVWARQHGLIGDKAQMVAGTADWPTFLALLVQAVAVGGLILFGLIAIWVFGREWSDRTAKDLLALPTARRVIVGAKFIVVSVWSMLIAALIFVEGLGIGTAVGLPGLSSVLILDAALQIAFTAGLAIALVTPFAWTASAGRGYMAAIGALFLVLVMAQIVAAAGWGALFPWSVPALLSGIAGDATPLPGTGSYFLVLLTGGAGVIGTLTWWRHADQT